MGHGHDYETRRRVFQVQVGQKALTVRKGSSLSSERLGQLQPGQDVTVLEERVHKVTGDVRAHITFHPRALSHSMPALDLPASPTAVAPPLVVSRSSPTPVAHPNSNPIPSPPLVATHIHYGRSSPSLPNMERPSTSLPFSYGSSSSPDSSHHSHPHAMSERPPLGTEDRTPPCPTGHGPTADDLNETSVADSADALALTQALPLVGWVTLRKRGTTFVSSRVRLDPAERSRNLALWTRRQTDDRLHHGNVLTVEAAMLDVLGVGFAYGGVHPGPLHSRGKLHEVHKVSYSVGRIGRYLLHVRLS